jgi:hypothetical protein
VLNVYDPRPSVLIGAKVEITMSAELAPSSNDRPADTGRLPLLDAVQPIDIWPYA